MAADYDHNTTTKTLTTTATLLKSASGRINYNLQKYCATCGYKLPKELLRCPDCKRK